MDSVDREREQSFLSRPGRRHPSGTRTTPIWLDQAEAMKLEQAAVVFGCSRSELIRTILRYHMLERFGGHGSA